jgi:hypothetical protein
MNKSSVAKRQRKNIILTLLTGVISLIPVFATAYYKNNDALIVIGASFIPFFIATFWWMVTYIEKSHEYQAEITEKVDSLLRGATYLKVFKTPEDALEYFTRRIPDMSSVRNTSVCCTANKPFVEAQYINQKWYPEYIMAVFNPIKTGILRYRDILSPAIIEIKGHRYNLFRQKGLKSEFYRPRKFPYDIEYTEFTIMYYNNRAPTEVLFGWHHSAETGDHVVILTSEPNIVSYFENHYEYLWGISEQL